MSEERNEYENSRVTGNTPAEPSEVPEAGMIYSRRDPEEPRPALERAGGRAEDSRADQDSPSPAVSPHRYYDYGTDMSRRGMSDVGSAGSGAEKNRSGAGGGKKRGGKLALVLSVILVFILGAGVGTYVSGRSSAVSLTDSANTARASDRKEVGSGKNEAEDSGADSDEKGGNSSEADAANKNADAEEKGGLTGKNRENETLEGVSDETETISKVETEKSSAQSSNSSIADVAEKVMPSIVSVYNKFTEQSQFFGHTYTQEGESAGSGIIIGEADGELLIVTNNHVVEGADSLSVQFIDEENCEAVLKGTDPGSDLAVIAVPVSSLSDSTQKAIAVSDLGDSEELRIGEQVIAIGNALGYGQSLTVGYVSALNREISDESGITGTFIQTDAAINPGNSGGALLNTRGQVIGINSNKIGGSAVEGMGFAIPISKAIPIINNLKAQESKTKVAEEDRGVIGIKGISVTSDVASAYGLPVGAYVAEIIEGSGAASSDLNEGDVITGIEGVEISSMEGLQQQLIYYAAGTEITLTIQHPVEGGKYEEKEIKLTLSRAADLQGEESGNESGMRRREEETDPFGDDQGMFGFPFGSFGF